MKKPLFLALWAMSIYSCTVTNKGRPCTCFPDKKGTCDTKTEITGMYSRKPRTVYYCNCSK